MDFSILGTNHVCAPVDIREKFAFDQDSQLAVMKQIGDFVDEIVLLSTCNRTEVMYHSNGEKSHERIRDILSTAGKVERGYMDRYFYFYRGRQALIHLFRVASGLDSMVLGETQILGQTKSAFEFSLKNGYSKDRFTQIYQRMLNTAKTVRRETGVSTGSVSVGSIAAQLAKNIFETLHDKRVTLIGAGEMCELAAEHLMSSGVRRITIVNRSKDKALRLAEQLSASAHTLDELPRLLPDTDIILSSVSSAKPVITYDSFRKTIKKRRGRALFIIDIGVPRNVESRVNSLADVYLYNIDDLKKLVNENLKERQREAATAEALIKNKVDEIFNLNGKLVGELILSLQERVATIKSRELEQLFQRNRHLSDDDKRQVEHSINLIINKILHDPIISLRRELSGKTASTNYIVRKFKDFFNL